MSRPSFFVAIDLKSTFYEVIVMVKETDTVKAPPYHYHRYLKKHQTNSYVHTSMTGDRSVSSALIKNKEKILSLYVALSLNQFNNLNQAHISRNKTFLMNDDRGEEKIGRESKNKVERKVRKGR